jgi:hypothetical protein
MNRALYPRDRGSRGNDPLWPSRSGWAAAGAFGLVGGVMDSGTPTPIAHVSWYARAVALNSLIFVLIPLAPRQCCVPRPERVRPAYSFTRGTP